MRLVHNPSSTTQWYGSHIQEVGIDRVMERSPELLISFVQKIDRNFEKISYMRYESQTISMAVRTNIRRIQIGDVRYVRPRTRSDSFSEKSRRMSGAASNASGSEPGRNTPCPVALIQLQNESNPVWSSKH